MAPSPISQHPPAFYPRHPARSLPSSRRNSRSSSVESRPRGRPIYSQHRSPSQDSLYLSMDSTCGPIQRWDGLAREATEWNSLRRDPELYLPIGNCLVFLYAAGSSQRGPSFRVPYDLLLYSGCRPLIDRCIMSASDSEYHPASSTPPSYDTVDYPMSSQDNCSFLYLPSPTGLSRDESYVYHLTTRNFFAWLLGVPLVGTDPVSALLDLKLRMDVWRDPGSGNFGALFDYVKEQGYGDFEALEIEMGKRLNSDVHQANGTMGFPPTHPVTFHEQRRTEDEVNPSRRNSLTQKIKRKLSRSRGREEERPAPTIPAPNNLEARLQTLRLNSYTHGPPPPSADQISMAMQRLAGPPSTQSVNTAPNVPDERAAKVKKRRSWTNIAGNAWKRKSMSMTDVRLPPLQTQLAQPGDSSTIQAPYTSGPYTSGPYFAQAAPLEPTSARTEKRNRRLSWKRASMTDIKLPSPQGQQPLPKTSVAINRPPSAPAPAPAHASPSRPASRSASVSPEEKKKRRLSWANVSDKIFDMMMPPTSKDDLPPTASTPGGPENPPTSKPAELPALEKAVASPSASSAGSIPTIEGKSIPSKSEGGGAIRSSSRHPSIHDFSTGQDFCACCGKVRQPRPPSVAGPSRGAPPQQTPIDSEDVKKTIDSKGTFEDLHDHMKNRRNKFKAGSYKEIILPQYGNGIRGPSAESEKGKNRSDQPVITPAEVRTEKKPRKAEAGRFKTRSIDAAISSGEARAANVRRPRPPPVESVVSPVATRAKELEKLNTKSVSSVDSTTKTQYEKSQLIPSSPMLVSELVASPTSLREPYAAPASSDSSSLRAYRRLSRPVNLDYEQDRFGAAVSTAVTMPDGGKGGVNDIRDVHHQVTTAIDPATSHLHGNSSARPVMEGGPDQEQAPPEEKFHVVDANFESNIEDLLAQLEAAGISEATTTTENSMGKDKRKSLVDLEPRVVEMPRMVYEVA